MKLNTSVFILALILFVQSAAGELSLPDINTHLIAPADAAPVIKNTVNVPPAVNTINVPPAVNNINVPSAQQKVDWTYFLAQLGAAYTALIAVYQFIKLHHAELAKVSALEDFVAYCCQNSGNGPDWLENAFNFVGNEFRKRFGKTMTEDQWNEIKHALSALHLEVGLAKSEPDPEIAAAEKNLATIKARKLGMPSVVTALMMFGLLLSLSGCASSPMSKEAKTAYDNSVKRRDAHIATLEAAQRAEDEALASAAANNYQFRLDTRNATCNAVAAQRPDLLPQVLAAKDQANAEYNALIAAQNSGQAKINAVIAASNAKNIQQAHAIDAAILKASQPQPFDGTAAVTTIFNGLQQLQAAPKATTISTAPIAPQTPVKAEVLK